MKETAPQPSAKKHPKATPKHREEAPKPRKEAAATPEAAVVPAKRRRKSGVAVAMDIRKQQKAVGMLLCKAPFRRLLRDVMAKSVDKFNTRTDKATGMKTIDAGPESAAVARTTKEALRLAQEATEDHVMRLYSGAMDLARYTGRTTMMGGDLRMVEWLRNDKH